MELTFSNVSFCLQLIPFQHTLVIQFDEIIKLFFLMLKSMEKITCIDLHVHKYRSNLFNLF